MISDRNSHIILIDRLRTFSIQLKYHNAVSELYYLAFKAGFRPGQPRVPRGNSDGGQWTLVGGKPWRLYPREPVDLQVEEARGGHAIAYHVGKSEQYLYSRALEVELDLIIIDFRKNKYSSYYDLNSANYYTNMVLNANATALEKVRTGEINTTSFSLQFEQTTGYQLYVTGYDEDILTGKITIHTAMRATTGARVVVRRDNRNRNGFRVVTSFPIMEGEQGND